MIGKTLRRSCQRPYKPEYIRKEVKETVEDEYGNVTTVVTYKDILKEDYLQSLPDASMYDLKNQIDAGVNLKEVSFSMDSSDPINAQEVATQRATLLTNQLNEFEEKNKPQVDVTPEPINNDE